MCCARTCRSCYSSRIASPVAFGQTSLIALKRLTKALGNITMVLVILTDPDPKAALKRVFARTAFLLIPISVMLIKYYPDIGRAYLRWEWTTVYVGVATDKNGLGAVCLVFGVPSLWRVIEVIRQKASSPKLGPLIAHGFIVAMTLWLFKMADSSTSLACFLLAGMLMLLTLGDRSRPPVFVHGMIATLASIALSATSFTTPTCLPSNRWDGTRR